MNQSTTPQPGIQLSLIDGRRSNELRVAMASLRSRIAAMSADEWESRERCWRDLTPSARR